MPHASYAQSATLKRLLLTMRLFADGRYHNRAELDAVLHESGEHVCTRTAQRLIKDLEKAGMIARHPKACGNGMDACWRWNDSAAVKVVRCV